MERLAGLLADDRGEVEFDLEFGLEVPGVRYLAVRASAGVVLECQRSLETFEYPLAVDVRLGMIDKESDEAGLPAGFEPLLLEKGTLQPMQVIEDELLLAMPPFPVKPGIESELKTWDGNSWTTAQPDETGSTENPFAALRDLKKSER